MKRVRKLVNRAKIDYNLNELKINKRNPKKIWKIIKNEIPYKAQKESENVENLEK